MTSTLPLNSMSTLQTLPSPPANEAELSKPGVDVNAHNGSNSILASRRQNVSLPAFTFPSPSQRTFGYGLHSPAPSLLTPPSGNDHMSPVDSNSSVNASFWATNTPSHPQSSSAYPYASGASSQSAYSTAPSLAASPAYAARGIVSPVSTSSRSQPLSPHHQEPASSASQQSTFDASYNSNLSVPVTNGQSYANGFAYSQHGQMTPAGQSALSSPHESYPQPSSLPPPTPSSGYYAQHNPSYSYHGHPMSVGQTSPSVPRPPTAGSLSHLHPLHASGPLNHNGYQSTHQRFLPNGMATSIYAQHGASMMGGLPPHLAGSLPQHAHMHPSQHAAVPHQERPFRCDQCPQSFNRNHDLKRHKRIHLAVKPFPCPNCDKSFSRKDALKRHVLVKGCGSTSTTSKPPTASS